MALWKPLKGTRTALDNVEKHDGYVYFCIDDGSLHFDYLDSNGNLQRKQINAKEAEKLIGYDITTVLSSSDVAIPTSKAVFTELTKKSDDGHGHEIADVTGLQDALDEKANTSHGNHVPTTQTADNAKFLRNDNTWQIVTPENIGAATEVHTHSAGDIISDTLPIERGGTGADNAVDALANLGIYIGATEPTDPNIKVWINTAEEGTGVVPVLPRISTINLQASAWTGSSAPFKQTVTINTVTSATKIDLQPTAAQLVNLQNEDISLMAENNGGVVNIYSFGGKPSSDIAMQVMLMEVSYV